MTTKTNRKPVQVSGANAKPAAKAKPAPKPEAKAPATAPKAPAPAAKPSCRSVCRELIRAGKTNAEIWAIVQPMFSMPDKHKHYPAWSRNEMKREAETPEARAAVPASKPAAPAPVAPAPKASAKRGKVAKA